MIFLKVFLMILATILIILLVCLLAKVKYGLSSHIGDDSIDINSSIVFLFGIITIKFIKKGDKLDFSVCLFGKRMKKKNKKQKYKKKKNNKKKKKWKSIFTNLLEYFRQVLNILKPKVFKIEGVYGFYDPSITGIISAILPIVTEIVPLASISLDPTFEEEKLDISIKIYGDITPIVLAIRTLSFLLSRDVRKVIFEKS
ncbi:hypothetical protein BJV85_000637 [Clostridium acetobutylicum]|uniref:Predicted membrane protein n=1 Tax=Clostridium acetobutylicum (strain ATCC 824 / DSM 792 / JCM 1419 / IAM 19013 / LMG 5710 / NBRC 13948 / NRRL B-527 / VKM B-1787 / 2291 / W) TaxID=272562 RepID=Q97E51_CLOAB|nr:MULTISPECIES: DUF2953 domain-containing protein [Clostridium]AAK81199.1 Predicted membrane protein [Clostridium acetobutylicum ATCC 824]ADZ22304.1 membrane protein [Clostridium acetobutylicum EA 2018]AEI32741.1 hypothetical protein SMB_G3301 [Clostridium acetobutylicum DSM 1731]AWV81131.1 DUF2953 domain-containing protein [Clostridium acetobutylicum]MBC2395666.1 DUF2953 domain-containing protein [Clostridium acetobutylicum]